MSRPAWRLGTAPWLGRGAVPARVRVVVDNDVSGDPDGLVQVAHHLLSPAADVRAVVGSHLAPGDGMNPGATTAADACDRLRDLFAVMGLGDTDRIAQGAETALADDRTPHDSAGARAIVAEAMRDDPRPLYLACGGGLTEVASAWLLEPRIADRLTLVWIGGPEHPGHADPPPGAGDPEYNLAIDLVAAQVVLGRSGIPVWQVPRDVYRSCLASDAELRVRMRPHGALGRHLHDALARVRDGVARSGYGYPETYALGDSPLVLLTALQSLFDPAPSSSRYVDVPRPTFDDGGRLVPGAGDATIRVHTAVDTRLVLEDLYAKLAAFAAWQDGTLGA